MDNSQVVEIEKNIQQSRVIVDVGNSLERLQDNRDFRKVVMEGYFQREAIRLVHLKADPSMQTAAMQASIVSQMDAIGALNQYFETIFHQAALATKAIAADEETIAELAAEELGE